MKEFLFTSFQPIFYFFPSGFIILSSFKHSLLLLFLFLPIPLSFSSFSFYHLLFYLIIFTSSFGFSYSFSSLPLCVNHVLSLSLFHSISRFQKKLNHIEPSVASYFFVLSISLSLLSLALNLLNPMTTLGNNEESNELPVDSTHFVATSNVCVCVFIAENTVHFLSLFSLSHLFHYSEVHFKNKMVS